MDAMTRVVKSEAEAAAYALGVKDERARQLEIRSRFLAVQEGKLEDQRAELRRLNNLIDDIRNSQPEVAQRDFNPGAHPDGETIEAVDLPRLTALMLRVFDLTRDGRWWTLARISEETGGTEASVSARLRDLRKNKFGGFTVERMRASEGSGLFLYRVIVPCTCNHKTPRDGCNRHRDLDAL